MKREVIVRLMSFSLLTLVVLSIFLSVVSAADSANQSTNSEKFAAAVEGFFKGVGSAFSPMFSSFFGQQEILSRLFMGLLLFMVIYSVIGQLFESGRWFTWIITGAVTVLAMIAIPADFISMITTQYGAMGAAILSVIPFAIILLFSVKVKSLLVARLVWIFYCFYFLALMLYNSFASAVDVKNNPAFVAAGITSSSYVYLAGFLLGVLIFFFIPMVRKFFTKEQIRAREEAGAEVAMTARALNKIEKQRLEAETSRS